MAIFVYDNKLGESDDSKALKLIWGFPIILALIQIFLLLFVFNFDTPFQLKKAGKFEKLTTVMNNLYEKD